MKNELIVKHNDFIEAKYNLSLTELKIIAKLSSMIKKNDDNFTTYHFRAKELLDTLNLNNNYDDLRDAIRKLLTRIVIIKTNNSILATTFLSSAEYFNNSTIELSFDMKLKPYLLQLKNNFTMYQFENVIALNSVYAIRIYELCKQYETIRERTIEIKELKEILDIKAKSYNIYNRFKTKVLAIAEREINEKTDINITFEEIKTGRKVTSIKFKIKSKVKKTNYEKELEEKIRKQNKKLNENTFVSDEKIDFENLTEKEKEYLERVKKIQK